MSQEINLLNPALRPKRDFLAAKTVALLSGVAVLLVALFYGHARMSAGAAVEAQNSALAGLKQLQNEVQAAQAALAARVPNQALENEIISLNSAIRQRGEVLHLAESLAATGSGGVAEVMRGFSRQRMEGVWLTGFGFGPGGFDIRGRLLDPSLLPTYIQRLNVEPAFRGRTFAALDMQGVVPVPVVAQPGAAVAMPATVSAPVRYTEFSLRASLPATSALGGKE